MTFRVALAAMLVGTCLTADGAIVTFNDLPTGTNYDEGDSFVSGGVNMTVVSPAGGKGYFWLSDVSLIGEGNVAVMRAARALSFDVPNNTMYVDFEFDTYGGTTYLAINGDAGMIPTSGVFSRGGTTGTVIGSSVSIVGAVSTLAIGGQEFDLDNVNFQPAAVPEPGSWLLLGGAITGLVLHQSRRSNGRAMRKPAPCKGRALPRPNRAF